MLKVVFFALLVIGCKCLLEPYSVNSVRQYDRYLRSGWSPLTDCSPVDDYLSFTVIRECDITLSFEPTSGGLFRCGKKEAQLISINIVFYTEYFKPELMLKFKVLNSEKDTNWIVTSQIFATPKKLIGWFHSERDAVLLSSLDQHFANELDKQHGELESRNTAFSLDWVKELFLEVPPRFSGCGSSRAWENFSYQALPVLISPEVYKTLDKVRTDMEIAPEDSSESENSQEDCESENSQKDTETANPQDISETENTQTN